MNTSPNEIPSATEAPLRLWQRLLLLYSAVHLSAWVVLPLWINRVPPGDNYEQLRWAEHLAWGYDKHPPMPTIVLWLFEQVFPTGLPLTYALGGLQVAIVFATTWWVTRQALDERRAIVAVLWVSCITYFTNRVHFYNHNTGLLVAYAMSVAAVYKAVQTNNPLWYVLLGVSWALGMLSKYQMVIGIASNGAFVLWVNRDRWLKALGQLCIAGVVCSLLMIPHVIWLVDNHFPSFNYAAKFVAANFPWSERPADIVGFWLNQAMRIAPLAALLFVMSRFPIARAIAKSHERAPDKEPWVRSFLLTHAWGPMILMSSLSLFFGTDLQMHWGTAFIWTFVILFLCSRAGQALAALPLKLQFIVIASLQAAMLLSYR